MLKYDGEEKKDRPLRDVLLAIGPTKAEPTMGRIKELECAGAPLSARSLEETREKGTILAGALLLDLAEQGFGEKAHRWGTEWISTRSERSLDRVAHR